MKPGNTASLLARGAPLRRAGRRVAAAAAVALCALFACPALADQAMVIWKNRECGYFILQMKSGYGIFQWIDGPHPNDGDVLEGDFRSAGERLIDNKTADVPTTILLYAFALSRSAIAARMPAKCKAVPGYTPFKGR
jgi:hypothetical protein